MSAAWSKNRNMDNDSDIYMLGQLVGAARGLACETFEPGTPPISCLRHASFLLAEITQAFIEENEERMAFLAASCAGTLTRLIEILAEKEPSLIVATIDALESVIEERLPS